jgi:hypothetical protein
MAAGCLYVKNGASSDDAVRFAGRLARRSVRNEAGDCGRRPSHPTRARSFQNPKKWQAGFQPDSSRFQAAEIYAFSEACIAQAQPADFRALSPLT